MRAPHIACMLLAGAVGEATGFISSSVLPPCLTRRYVAPETLNFLASPDQSLYLASILRRATDACNKCLKDGCSLIEVEFPANRKSDLSVTETLDTNRGFARDFVKAFSTLGKDLWLVFPDRSECSLGVLAYYRCHLASPLSIK